MGHTIEPSPFELRELVHSKHDGGDLAQYGRATRMRLRFGYYTPDEAYEALVARLVGPGCTWLDVGCGRELFPNNRRLSHALAGRCALLVGLDPDETIEENPFVHWRVRSSIGEFRSDLAFDLVTLRMVAEHITDPDAAVASLARVTKPGGKVVLYSVNKWSPISIVSRIVPFGLHHPIKRRLWNTEEKDTFPVAYRMNTRRRLRELFEAQGFRESGFLRLDDCKTFANTRLLHFLELSAWRVFKGLGFSYPENCLLGVYDRVG
jgi:SAM-dependent methyltransferase